MQHPDEGMIHTWLDGELPHEEAAELEAHVAECDECKALVAEARGFIAASSRIVGALDNVPSGVMPVAKPVKRMWYSSPQFRAAAAVVVVAGASLLVFRTGTQKATLSDIRRPEASEAATLRSMAAGNSAVIQESAAVQSPVVADQVAAKAASPKPAAAAPPKVVAALEAPVRARAAVPATVPMAKISNEADFSGRAVQGGISNGVVGTALSGKVSGIAMKASDAMSPRAAFSTIQPGLKVIRVDSAARIKKTTYESASGKEVVLTEEEMTPDVATVTGTLEETRQIPATPPAPAPANRAAATAPLAPQAIAVNKINWIDPVTRRFYTLSGPVPVAELEAMKVRLLQQKN